jgi:hypothetical protein
MPAEKPCIVEGQDNGELFAQEWQGPQVEIIPVEIMTVQDIRVEFRNEVQ